MSENAVVRARINEDVKEEASAVLEAMGLTVSDAFRMMMVRIAREKALPFELVPNDRTVEAIQSARGGKTEPLAGGLTSLVGTGRSPNSFRTMEEIVTHVRALRDESDR